MTESPRYWVCWDGCRWIEVTLTEWIEWEKACGFHGHGPFDDMAATASFDTGSVKGQTWNPFEK